MIINLSCNKDDELQDAVITGLDGRMCACCGGMMVNFENDTIPYSGNFCLATNDPSEFGLGMGTRYPLFVSITWKWEDTCTSFRKIKILKLRYR